MELKALRGSTGPGHTWLVMGGCHRSLESLGFFMMDYEGYLKLLAECLKMMNLVESSFFDYE